MPRPRRLGIPRRPQQGRYRTSGCRDFPHRAVARSEESSPNRAVRVRDATVLENCASLRRRTAWAARLATLHILVLAAGNGRAAIVARRARVGLASFLLLRRRAASARV